MISILKLRETYKKINPSQSKSVTQDIKNMGDILQLRELFLILQYIRKGFYRKLIDQEKLIIEKYKLAIIQTIADILDKCIITSKKRKKKSLFKKLFANIFTLLTPVLTGIGGFTGCKGLLNLIPGISNPVILAVGITVGVIEGALSLSSDVKDVRKNLGVSPLQATPLIRVYTKQLETTQKIHDSLLSSRCTNRLSASEYQTYKKVTGTLHQDIKEKNAILFKKHKPSLIRKGIKWLVGGIEATLFASSGYFLAKGILGLCASALLATPMGWAIGGAAALFSLGSFYYIRRKNLLNTVDHISGDPKTLKKSQDKFINGDNGIKKFEKEMDHIIATKKKSDARFDKLTKKVKSLKTQMQCKSSFFNAYKNKKNKRTKNNFFFKQKKENSQPDRLSFYSTQICRIR